MTILNDATFSDTFVHIVLIVFVFRFDLATNQTLFSEKSKLMSF